MPWHESTSRSCQGDYYGVWQGENFTALMPGRVLWCVVAGEHLAVLMSGRRDGGNEVVTEILFGDS